MGFKTKGRGELLRPGAELPDDSPAMEKRRKVAALYNRGMSKAEIKRETGVAVSTITTWIQRDSAFQEMLVDEAGEVGRVVSGQIADLMPKAVQRLAEMLEHPDPKVCMSALELTLGKSGAMRAAALKHGMQGQDGKDSRPALTVIVNANPGGEEPKTVDARVEEEP